MRLYCIGNIDILTILFCTRVIERHILEKSKITKLSRARFSSTLQLNWCFIRVLILMIFEATRQPYMFFEDDDYNKLFFFMNQASMAPSIS